MTELRLSLLGFPRLEYLGNVIHLERRKALALAAYLALSDRRESREMLVDLLWPELDRNHGRSALRSTLRALVAPMPIAWVDADRESVRLSQGALWVDVHAFMQLLASTTAHGHRADKVCDRCISAWNDARALYQADFMMGFSLTEVPDFEDWQLAQRAWLRHEYSEVLRRLSVHYAEQKVFDQALRLSQQWLALDPLHEPAHRQIMGIYASSGQRSEALRQYRQVVDILDRELGAFPEDETTRFYERILAGHEVAAGASVATSPHAINVLPPCPTLMVGRGQVLNDLKHRLGVDTGSARPVTVIQGWPGVGKSSIVAMLAHDLAVARQFPDGILWAPLGEQPNIRAALMTWADALGLSEPGRALKTEEISAQLTAVLRDARMLLIVDDIWHIEDAGPFRVGGQQCALIFTSRLNDVAMALAPTATDLYRLPVLNDEAGIELLQRLAPETVREYPDEALEMVRNLEGLPLAIHVAGRLLHSEAHLGWGVRDLLAELQLGARVLEAQPPSDMFSLTPNASSTVFALLTRSTDMLDAQTLQQFAFLGLFAPKPATFDLAAMSAVWNVADPRPVARTLVNRGLIEPVSGGRFQMHALLVLHARALLGGDR